MPGFIVSGCRGARTSGLAANEHSSVNTRQSDQAREAAVRTLLALKARDVGCVKSLLYSKGSQYGIVSKKGRRCLSPNAAIFELDSMKKYDIEKAVSVVPEANADLLADMARFDLSYKWIDHWSPRGLRLAAVKFRLPNGMTILTAMVEEGGVWKMNDFSVCRIGILKYRRVVDAINAHDKNAFVNL